MIKRTFITLIALFSLMPSTVDALSQDQINIFRSGIYYYNTTDDIGSSCSTGDVPISAPFPAVVIDNINKSKAAYIQASQATGVPWQLIAAVHYREASNNPAQDIQAGNPFGGPYKQESTDYGNGYPQNLEQSAEIAAKHLIAVSSSGVVKKPVNIPSPDPEAVKDTLYSYNGRAPTYADQAARLGFNRDTQPYEGSAYVMNNFDSRHTGMMAISKDHGPADTIDSRLGAFTFYYRLIGGSPDGKISTPLSNCTTNINSGDIVAIARSQVGTKEDPLGSNCGGTPQQDGLTVASYTSSDRICEFWCADFVSWVYNKAGRPFTGGVSGGWRIPGVFKMEEWLMQNGTFTTREQNAFPPQPGDVISFAGDGDGHVGIVESVDGDTVNTIEGNSNDQVSDKNSYQYKTSTYVRGWGRMK